jgi:hypothetical protein|eukprot:COSAG06_NODE_401_length_16198_cov_469.489596_9_plen_51_part_00
MQIRAERVPVDVNTGEWRRSQRRLSWLLQLTEEFLPLAESATLGVPLAKV